MPATGTAQQFPQKNIRFVVPFPPGGATDALARILAEPMSEAYGQPVVIDNRPGAGGNIAADFVARAPADGYTIIMVGISHAANLSLYSKLNYHPVKDFAPVTQAVAMNMFLAVHPSLPVKSVKELVALAKAKPGELNYASGGNDSTPHMAMELFKGLSGINLVHVPYKGTQSVVGMLRGEAAVIFENLISIGAYLRDGRLRPLAVGATERSSAFPDLPTVAEAGVPGYEMFAWFGVLAPAGTPQPVIDSLYKQMASTLKTPQVKERFAKLGADPVGSRPDQFGAFIQSEVAKWAKVIKAAGLKID
jgi:tripartite-type tricarboxylate transporter receptor subunit TctC